MEFEDSIYITYGILDYIFQMLDTEDANVKQIMRYLTTLSQKSENDIAKHYQEKHNFMTKTKNYLKKLQITLRNYIQFSQKKGKETGSWAYGCFLPKSRYHSIYFKKIFQF